MSEQQYIQRLATKYDVSTDTVREINEFLKRAMGTFVRFDIEELGGEGRWTRSEVTISRDDDALRKRVDGLCRDLAKELEFIEPDNLSKDNTRRNMPSSFKPYSSDDSDS